MFIRSLFLQSNTKSCQFLLNSRLLLKCPNFSFGLKRFKSDNVLSSKFFDVIVVGGGHAGVEAAAASARMSCRTLLVTHRFDTIGEMSCNPAFGGIGKGQLIREIDALDGICARICDKSGIQYKVLNRSKGPAVWGLRAQIDRSLYKQHMQEEVRKTPNLEVYCAAIEDLLLEEIPNPNSSSSTSEEYSKSRFICKGIVTSDGITLKSHSVVISTGTFLRGEINIGLEHYPAGRLGDKPAIGLANTFEDRIGFRLGRLKTGTPPRIDRNTIDFDGLESTIGDNPPIPFSFLNQSVWIKPEDQCKTWLTFTNDEVTRLVGDNIHLSRHVREEVRGPRYCPSIESKILKFKSRLHQIWLEPEGLNSDVIYPNGISCTLPEELQREIINSIDGLRRARMLQPGYGVEYDYVDPRQIRPTLETKLARNLFLAGQINGTTGYEEAASQGIVAGINAALKARHFNDHPDQCPKFTLSRTEAYIGVLIDDLTSLGTSEPYRMFTSRAEFRLLLRPDNADLRLTKSGYEIGCVSEERYRRTTEVRDRLENAKSFLQSIQYSLTKWKELLMLEDYHTTSLKPKNGLQMMAIVTNWASYSRSNNNNANAFHRLFPKELAPIFDKDNLPGSQPLSERLTFEAFYQREIVEQQQLIEEIRREESMIIDENIDYDDQSLNLSNEVKDLLGEYRPGTIGAATRIPGVTPAAIVMLLFYMRRFQLKQQQKLSELV